MARYVRGKIANDIQAFGCRFEIGIGKRAAVCYREIRPGDFEDNNAHLGISGSNLGRGEIAGGDIVVIPKTEMNHLPARKEFPHLRSKNAEVRAGIRGSLRPRMAGQNMQDAHPEATVLLLLAPHPGRQVHQRGKGTIRTAQDPDPGEFFRV